MFLVPWNLAFVSLIFKHILGLRFINWHTQFGDNLNVNNTAWHMKSCVTLFFFLLTLVCACLDGRLCNELSYILVKHAYHSVVCNHKNACFQIKSECVKPKLFDFELGGSTLLTTIRLPGLKVPRQPCCQIHNS